jgi:putative effector of murein hydrolase
MGVATYGIATACAFKESKFGGSFAGLSMALNSIVTALLALPVVRLFGFA